MRDLYLGIDVGTSGVRAIVIDQDRAVVAEAKSAMTDHGDNHRSPRVWQSATELVVRQVLSAIDPTLVRALAVDGTSGTMIALDRDGQPLGDGVMYNDPCTNHSLIHQISTISPETTAARGASSALARAVELVATYTPDRVVHQADWIAMLFGAPVVTDENNALKTGYDPVTGDWPQWIAQVIDPAILPPVVPAGTRVGTVGANSYGLDPNCAIVAGTTDGCASFLATGADQPGAGVTALGTTMTIKLLSDKPIFAPGYGIYSHRILGLWLAGGASNTGGNVIKAEFPDTNIDAISDEIDSESDIDLDYYPLKQPGERFPINDPGLLPRLGPRPVSDADHLHGIFQGIAKIEALAYRRLAELGAPRLTSVRAVGGGAGNATWTRIRERHLGVPMVAAASGEAAFGTALLAMVGPARG